MSRTPRLAAADPSLSDDDGESFKLLPGANSAACQQLALLAISLRSGDRPQLGVELPSPDRQLGLEPDPEQASDVHAGDVHHDPFAHPAGSHAESLRILKERVR